MVKTLFHLTSRLFPVKSQIAKSGVEYYERQHHKGKYGDVRTASTIITCF